MCQNTFLACTLWLIKCFQFQDMIWKKEECRASKNIELNMAVKIPILILFRFCLHCYLSPFFIVASGCFNFNFSDCFRSFQLVPHFSKYPVLTLLHCQEEIFHGKNLVLFQFLIKEINNYYKLQYLNTYKKITCFVKISLVFHYMIHVNICFIPEFTKYMHDLIVILLFMLELRFRYFKSL